MATTSDSFGLCNDLASRAKLELLNTILQELIQNRTHGVKLDKYKFGIVTGTDTKGAPVFMYGTNQYRSQESIENEHRVFNFTERTINDKAKIGTRGYGAKLFPFKVQGFYSVWYAIENTPLFNKDLTSWAQRGQVPLNSLIKDINSNKVINQLDLNVKYGGDYTSPCTDAGDNNRVDFDSFVNTDFYKFIEENNFKYFQVFKNYDTTIKDTIVSELKELAKLFETNEDVEIWYSNNFEQPVKICVEDSKESLHLHPKYWSSSLDFEWVIGPKVGEIYYQNKLLWRNPINEHECYGGEITSNGSTVKHVKKFDTRLKSCNLSFEEKQSWQPDVKVTVAITKPEYHNPANKQVYMFIENNLISSNMGTIGLDAKFRNLGQHQSRLRIIIHILKNNIKYDGDYGLAIEDVKRKSSLIPKKAIYWMVESTLKTAKKYHQIAQEFDNSLQSNECFVSAIHSIPGLIAADKAHTEKSKQRKVEGILYEKKIKDYLQENFQDYEHLQDCNICFENNDSEISAEHKLDNLTGIDQLITLEKEGLENKIRICMQAKSKTKLNVVKDINPFVNTISALKEKYQTDIFYSYFIVEKPMCITGNILSLLQAKDINCVFDNDETGEEIGDLTLQKITDDLFKSPFSICSI